MGLDTAPIFSHLEGKAAIVTGCNGPVGKALSEHLFESGALLFGTDVHAEPEIAMTDYFSADLSSSKGIFSVMTWIENLAPKVSLLVNNAALTPEGLSRANISEGDLDGFEQIMRVNVTVPFLLTNQLFESGKFASNAATVNIGSIFGVKSPRWTIYENTSSAGSVAYSVSKAAIIHLTKVQASKHASNLRINSVSPGGLDRNQDALFKARYRDNTPSSKMLTEQDVVQAVAFLSNPISNDAIRGHNLLLDGGNTLW